MIAITEAARRCFLQIKPTARSNGEVMRLDTVRHSANGKEPRVALYFGEVEVGDELVEHLGEPLLHVSRKISAAFDGCVVDLEVTPEEVAFTIGPPPKARYTAPAHRSPSFAEEMT